MNPSGRAKKTAASRPLSRDFRWCRRREQYVAVAVCEALAGQKALCRKCFTAYLQIPLPF
ncbi:MAG: hypothetical protein AB1921_08440 [Thermodesulfobacteriota bacterium]